MFRNWNVQLQDVYFGYVLCLLDNRNQSKTRKRAEKFSYFATTLIALHFSLCWALDLIDDPAFLYNESTFVATFPPSRKFRTNRNMECTSVLTIWCKVDWMQLRCRSSWPKRKTKRRRKETSGWGKVSVCLKYAFCRYNNTLVDDVAANFGCYEK